MATATKVHVLDCGAMSCDLTWLLLKPGRIDPTAVGEATDPVEWYPCTSHACWWRHRGHAAVGHQLPARLGEALGADGPAGVLPLRPGQRGGVPRLAAAPAGRPG